MKRFLPFVLVLSACSEHEFYSLADRPDVTAEDLEVQEEIGELDFDVTLQRPEVEREPWDGSFFVTRSNLNPNLIDVYVGLGDGTFNAPVAIGNDIGAPYGGLAIGDFDEDGELDIVASNDSQHYLLHYDDANQHWSQHHLGAITWGVRGGGDFNNDGHLDLFGWDSARTGYIALGDGQGNFTHHTGYFSPAGAWTSYAMHAVAHTADLNNDGHEDIALSSYSSGGSSGAGVYVAYGDGTGHFAAATKITTLPAPANGLDLGDVDRDGYADLLIGLDDDGDPGQTWLLYGSAQGLSSLVVPSLDVAPSTEYGSDQCCTGTLRLNDWNDDGSLDVLTGFNTGAWTNPQVNLFDNDGSDLFATPRVVLGTGAAVTTGIATPL